MKLKYYNIVSSIHVFTNKDIPNKSYRAKIHKKSTATYIVNSAFHF
jgi:hypothetical protein